MFIRRANSAIAIVLLALYWKFDADDIALVLAVPLIWLHLLPAHDACLAFADRAFTCVCRHSVASRSIPNDSEIKCYGSYILPVLLVFGVGVIGLSLFLVGLHDNKKNNSGS